ncbi:hypothetical protein VTJ04DRAFT_931 [Mycothermus thermophilus]|uniref:uncharacterized protein n=1 Tax=Humicola insolens TaxID=85995 RepID=UPI0037434751
MSNLVAPTVPSGPTTARASNGSDTRLTIAELQKKKDQIEGELRALGRILDSHGVDMNTSLLTPDGFPRADIDVVTIRTTRSRIIHLRNDWKELMNVIEKRLHEHFATVESDESDNEEETKKETTASAEAARVEVDLTLLPRDPVPETLDQPFAKVNTVADNSPAAAAGLKPGDLIRNFGYVNFQNHDNLRKVGECVQGNEGQTIIVKISRIGTGPRPQELRLNLVPRRDWGGRGMLGCHILPI